MNITLLFDFVNCHMPCRVLHLVLSILKKDIKFKLMKKYVLLVSRAFRNGLRVYWKLSNEKVMDNIHQEKGVEQVRTRFISLIKPCLAFPRLTVFVSKI